MSFLQQSKLKTKALANKIKGTLKTGLLAAMPITGTGAVGRFVFMDFCQPAKFYLVIALLSLIYFVSTDESFVWIILKAVIFIIWGLLLNKLCSMDLKAITWMMAIVPQAVFLLLTIKQQPANSIKPTPTHNFN